MAEQRPSSMAARVRVTRVGPGGGARGDLVVVEEPLRVHVTHRGEQHLLGSTMRTPGHDLELGVGLAVGEGVLRTSADLVGARPCRDGNGPQPDDVTVIVRDEFDVDRSKLGRVATPSSACGLCGRDEIDAIVAMAPPVERDLRVDVDVLAALPDAMRERQSVFRRTGGLHAAALATADGRILVVREDVGRHNAVDKAVGWAVMNGVVADVLVVSGRAGFEIVQKAAMAAIPVVVAVSAPTSLSVDVAQECGITLAAFVREGRANGVVYLRGQIGQDLDTRESVGIGDVEAQAEKAMANIAMLLEEAGSELGDIVKVVVYLTDIRFREPVYRVMGRWLKGVFPVSTGLVVTALARPEWLVEIDATAVIPDERRA